MGACEHTVVGWDVQDGRVAVGFCWMNSLGPTFSGPLPHMPLTQMEIFDPVVYSSSTVWWGGVCTGKAEWGCGCGYCKVIGLGTPLCNAVTYIALATS
jgi:hypothetical protein